MIKYLKSNQFAIIIAILSVVVQSFHSYTAVYNISSLKGTPAGVIQAALFALVFDAAILFFTVRNKRDVVLGASVFFVMMNVYYYYSHLGIQFDFMFGCLISLILPTMQYYYSEEIVEERPADETPLAIHAKSLADEVQVYKIELDEANADRGRLNDKIKHLQVLAGKTDAELNKELYARNLEVEELTASVDRRNEAITELKQEVTELNKLNEQQATAWEEAHKSNTILSEMLGKKDGEIIALRRQLGQVAELEPHAQHNYIEPKAYNPTRTDAPAV